MDYNDINFYPDIINVKSATQQDLISSHYIFMLANICDMCHLSFKRLSECYLTSRSCLRLGHG